MAVRIRLKRMGRKKQPHYRVVVADSKSPRDGRFVETLGYFKPLSSPARLVLNVERVDYWLGQGASPSLTVATLIGKARSGGDDTVALGEIDAEARKAAATAALAAKRAAEKAKAAEEAAAAEAKAAEEAAAAEAKAAEEAAAAEAKAAEEAAAAEAKAAEDAAAEAPAEEAEAPAEEAKEAAAEEAAVEPTAEAEEAPEAAADEAEKPE